MRVEVLFGEVISHEDVERESVDLNISADGQISGRNELHVVVAVLVLVLLEELAFDNSRVLLVALKDGQGVVTQVERNDETSVAVLWYSGVKSGSESKDSLVIINVFEEVSLGLLGLQSVDVA